MYYYDGKKWAVEWVDYGQDGCDVWLERDGEEPIYLSSLPPYEQELLLDHVYAERAINKYEGGGDDLI